MSNVDKHYMILSLDELLEFNRTRRVKTKLRPKVDIEDNDYIQMFIRGE